MAILAHHLLLASLAITLIFCIGLPLRTLLKRDAIGQYRWQTFLVVCATFLLPIQILVCETVLVDQGPESAGGFTNVSLNYDSLLYQFDADAQRPNSLGIVPEHDSVAVGTQSADPVNPIAGHRDSQAITGIESGSQAAGSIVSISRIRFAWIANCLGVIYLTGLGVCLFVLVLRVRTTRKLVFESQPLDDATLTKFAQKVIGEKISIRVSRQVATPSCLMFPRPLILFPTEQSVALSQEQLRCILLHEATHIQQRDWIVCTLEQVLLALMWFHPLAHKLVADNCRDRELACDARVVKETESEKTYAMSILACYESQKANQSGRSSEKFGALVTGFNSMKQIKRRLEMLNYATQKVSRLKVALVTLLCLVLIVSASTFHVNLLAAATPTSIRMSDQEASVDAETTSEDVDSDGDGLSDYQERHKYFTDPQKADSDGDGIADGDWLERREYQYTVRSVVQVLRPVTIEFLNDNFQDARVLDETKDHVELEIIHYPFNRVAESIEADDNWKASAARHAKWTQAGPSSDWTPEMRDQLKRELLQDGIDVDKLTDREIVEKVSRWLCDRAEFIDGFTTFVTAWDESGKPYIPDGLGAAAKQELAKSGLSIEDQWQREVSAKGMFKHKRRGSCTSSAIYLNGCFKALGIPTRTVLCIPIIDASDSREFDLVMNLQQRAVRQHLLRALKPLKESWSSHTFNEVFVGNRWHRLNYHNLGQGIYDQQLFGMVSHVATFNDWADAKAHETIGKRQKKNGRKDVFGFRNPYSAISLRDEIGIHCKVQLPEVQPERGHVVEKINWTDDKALPEYIRENCLRRGRFGFIAEVSGVGGMTELLSYFDHADAGVLMTPVEGDHPVLNIEFDRGCFWVNNDSAYIFVAFDQEDRSDLVKGIQYRFEPRDNSADKGWQLKEKFTAIRKRDIPK